MFSLGDDLLLCCRFPLLLSPVNRKAASNDAQGLRRNLGHVEHAGELVVARV